MPHPSQVLGLYCLSAGYKMIITENYYGGFFWGWEKGLAFFFCHTNKAICILEGVFAESQGLSRL